MSEADAAASFLAPLALRRPQLEVLAVDLASTYRNLALNSTEQFLATPINVLPRGTEEGTFLAIDVGGTNLRVGFVELLGDTGSNGYRPSDSSQARGGGGIRRLHERSWPIQDHFKMDQPDELFSWIGASIASVVADYCRANPQARTKVVPFGVTFSFPMIQTHISEAKIMAMGKGFAIKSEMELGSMILEGYAKHVSDSKLLNGASGTMSRLPDIKIVAITNDTVATLASLAYAAHARSGSKVAMGLIVGTGTNSSVTLKLKHLHEEKRSSIVLPSKVDTTEAEIVVNTEWTINGAAAPLHNAGLITEWDRKLDKDCEAPGFQPFEYMTAGRYLGEICRIILYDFLTKKCEVDERDLPEALCVRNLLPTFFLSNVVAKSGAGRELLIRLLKELPAPRPEKWNWTVDTADMFIATAKALQMRSSAMIASAVVGLLICAGELQLKGNSAHPQGETKPYCSELIVAYAGGVITSYPNFLDTCTRNIEHLVKNLTVSDPPKCVTLMDANDGGLVGAGVLAGTVWNLE